MIISYDHWFWLLQLIIDYNWSLIIGNFRLGSFVWEFSFGIFRLGTFAWEFSLGNFVINQWAIICKLSTIMNWTCVSVCCNNLAVALLSLQKFGSSKMEAQTIICLRQCLPHTLLCLGLFSTVSGAVLSSLPTSYILVFRFAVLLRLVPFTRFDFTSVSFGHHFNLICGSRRGRVELSKNQKWKTCFKQKSTMKKFN